MTGTDILIHPYAVFSSAQDFKQQNDYSVSFKQNDVFPDHLVVSVTKVSDNKVIIVGVFRKTSTECSYFKRLGPEGVKNFIISISIALVFIAITTILFIFLLH
ncbi:hypothetical protein RF11_07079 [Thelohanellus kitauei]|uniref:Uncharacterized protein n=1 Tax=Thelohanellus kitauei TaxID=669202 RepID=A0A0C2MKR2_THEKT|nr:hypothetical protein RF11_07079 [Thelohanellus kitauei]